MTTEGREDRDGMDPQDDEALWALLGRQQSPAQASPYFSRRVLREVALAEPGRATGWWARLGQGVSTAVFSRRTALWSGVFSGVCALGLFCLSNQVRMPQTGSSLRETVTVAQPSPVETQEIAAGTTAETPHEAVPVEEVEVIADLDNILQREESRLWTDDTARF